MTLQELLKTADNTGPLQDVFFLIKNCCFSKNMTY